MADHEPFDETFTGTYHLHFKCEEKQIRELSQQLKIATYPIDEFSEELFHDTLHFIEQTADKQICLRQRYNITTKTQLPLMIIESINHLDGSQIKVIHHSENLAEICEEHDLSLEVILSQPFASVIPGDKHRFYRRIIHSNIYMDETINAWTLTIKVSNQEEYDKAWLWAQEQELSAGLSRWKATTINPCMVAEHLYSDRMDTLMYDEAITSDDDPGFMERWYAEAHSRDITQDLADIAEYYRLNGVPTETALEREMRRLSQL